MTSEGREWLRAQPLPEVAREQVRVATSVVDELEAQIAPLDKELKGYAQRQAGCKALMRRVVDRPRLLRADSSIVGRLELTFRGVVARRRQGFPA